MKKIWAALLLAVIWEFPLCADNLPITGMLFVGRNYEYTFLVREKGWWLWQDPWPEWKVGEQRSLGKGSFWAVQTPDKTILITAAHVLGPLNPNWDALEIDGHKIDRENAFLTSVEGKVLLGTLSFEPSEIGRVKEVNDADAAFLTTKDSHILKTIKPLVLSDSAPEYGENVQVVGYPGTVVPQPATMSVAWVQEDKGFFVLNQAVDDGYSGGIVLNSSGKAYGVIVNTDAQKQTNVLRITPEMLKAIEWHPAGEMLNHEFH